MEVAILVLLRLPEQQEVCRWCLFLSCVYEYVDLCAFPLQTEPCLLNLIEMMLIVAKKQPHSDPFTLFSFGFN